VSTTEIAPEAIIATAVANYTGKPGYDSITDCLFALLTDVADVYLTRLEEGDGADDPAPFLGGTTPMEALMSGLAENLDMRRENTTEGDPR
jgi:hypothetical protein